jgi:DNA-3-methyladenine glycosylase
LGRDFFARSSDRVARDLIGKILWRTGVGGGRLTEVEAYLSQGDPASHSHVGETARNASMFGPPGHLYVYLSYGIHVLLNLVCDEEGVGAAVLVRALEPVGDPAIMYANRLDRMRSTRAGVPKRDTGGPAGRTPLVGDGVSRWLACGPGRVGQALALELDLDGVPLGGASGFYVIDDGVKPPVAERRRIGISKATDMLLRFVDATSTCVTERKG